MAKKRRLRSVCAPHSASPGTSIGPKLSVVDFMLKDKVVLVTGAASGIGRAIALVAAREVAHLVLADLDPHTGNETLRLVQALGTEALFATSDVGQPDDAQALVDQALAHFGRLDVACNNAGIGGPSALLADYPLDDWAQVINVNLSGVFYGMRCQIPAILRNGGGAIVNVASILGAVGFATAAAYTAAKHGVLGLTQAAALEYSGQGLRINAVGPGFIRTPMISALDADPAVHAALVAAHPIGRLGLPEEVAELVVWLASTRASFVTGSYHPVDGGYLAR
jgi:NAD(P)-dependent dehydrogenase (short-subunit alcohol dehydrogenase family)